MMAIATAALLGGCNLPRDPGRTADTVRARGEMRVGFVAEDLPDRAAEQQLASAAKAHGAQVRRLTGPSETLLRAIEEGELDLVYGRFPADSPWAEHVYLSRVPGRLAEPPTDVSAPRFAIRNGENGWIMAVERARP